MKKKDIIWEIKRMKEEKNAVILAHFYQREEVQEIADFVGDSLALSEEAEKTRAGIILFAGVHFMAETAKILSPGKKVLIPDTDAGCSLADSCSAEEFKKFIRKYPEYTVITYINTTAEVKALTDICCTSTNATKIIESLPENEKIIFAPDRNLGNYLKGMTGREMIIWNGACHVHEEFSVERIMEQKIKFPEAKIIAHPECEKPVQLISDYIGSTSALLSYTKESKNNVFIVATEPGILYQMKKANPHKKFVPAAPEDLACACSECEFMKMISLEKVYHALKNEKPEVILDEDIMRKARKPIMKMMEITKNTQL